MIREVPRLTAEATKDAKDAAEAEEAQRNEVQWDHDKSTDDLPLNVTDARNKDIKSIRK